MKVITKNRRVSAGSRPRRNYCSLPLTFAATFTGTLYIRAGIHGCTGTPPAIRV